MTIFSNEIKSEIDSSGITIDFVSKFGGSIRRPFNTTLGNIDDCVRYTLAGHRYSVDSPDPYTIVNVRSYGRIDEGTPNYLMGQTVLFNEPVDGYFLWGFIRLDNDNTTILFELFMISSAGIGILCNMDKDALAHCIDSATSLTELITMIDMATL